MAFFVCLGSVAQGFMTSIVDGPGVPLLVLF